MARITDISAEITVQEFLQNCNTIELNQIKSLIDNALAESEKRDKEKFEYLYYSFMSQNQKAIDMDRSDRYGLKVDKTER